MKILRHALLPVLIAAGFAAGSAQAAVIVNDWQINLEAATLAGENLDGTISGIDQITYQGIAQGTTYDSDAVAGLSEGDRGVTYGLLAATAYVVGGTPVPGQTDTSVLGIDYELTFTFEVDNVITNVDGLNTNSIHPAEGSAGMLTDGILKVYIDNLGDATGLTASTETGTGFDDGTLVATFRVIGGEVVFSFESLDGADDATFELVSALAGVILDSDGNDLTTGALLALTDSNFDADLNDDGIPDVPAPSSLTDIGGDLCPGPNSLACVDNGNFFAEEDGSVRIAAAVPEPASLGLLGAGLLGLAWQRRRRPHAV